MSGLSLWLSPPAASPLGDLITSLSDRYETVPFKAHATLVSDALVPGLPVAELVKRIGEAIARWKGDRAIQARALELRFSDVRQGQLSALLVLRAACSTIRLFHVAPREDVQCVLAALVPDAHLVALHETLLSSFSVPIPSPPTYFPHLSLVYGDLSPQTKEGIIQGMKERKQVQQKANGECRVAGEKGFKAEEVLLVRTSGSTDQWEILARVPL
ncbi:BZ3500_MvSof-1268-A1-R1_Chr5-3g08233 [Microbotryum saponariae]|uniref:BZ3500_MvSof-1268-A1-R1_Chr5-3g08233 protein n=1 Tax=Microbotryum saponariae TaxID=289078 RepID=A0A2X0KFM7_9BASI|nr:BZ3500_MvSof-1268-A1-R1_Chr5-3g08233 [Microbotryum saponariae]SDA07992.1 BZ3501_MvSof-1269-A2-R1_Chr5-1g07377 [Microbotryum saponariae]